jgi:NADPH2:quinone reductase
MSSAMHDMGMLARAPGGPEVLEWTSLETGTPKAGEALVAHRAIGLNFIDTYFRSGSYPWPSAPLIPGSEAAGIVEAVGAGVAGVAPGDRVAYTMPLGAYRQRRIIPADRLVKLPAAIPFEVAASVMLKGLTAEFLLTACFPVQAAQTVLVHAAAGGVGSLLGQWLKLIGATAIGTVGSADKVPIALANGYTHVIDYRAQDFAARVAELTQSRGCDVVYDSVGQDTWRGSLKCLKRRGMFVSFGQSSGAIVDFKLADLAAGGSLYAARPTLFDYIATPEDLRTRAEDLFSKLSAGQLRANVGRTWPLQQAADAHRALAARQTTGSGVLLP